MHTCCEPEGCCRDSIDDYERGYNQAHSILDALRDADTELLKKCQAELVQARLSVNWPSGEHIDGLLDFLRVRLGS